MTPNEAIVKMQDLQEKYLEGETPENEQKLQEFYNTSEYKALPYNVRNRGLITSHKLKEFMRCAWCYAQKYINEVPDPTEDGETKEAFVLGQAVDDYLTEGINYFDEKYEIVTRRSKVGALMSGKTQLTEGQGKLINQMVYEFRQNTLFNPNPTKKIILYKTGKGLVLKAELDDISDMIRDVKTCANVSSFNPQFYAVQATFYNMLVELKLDRKLEVMLEVVDKYKYFSRSDAWIYQLKTLHSMRGLIMEKLDEMQLAHSTGIFPSAKEQGILFDCPYYGYKGHGRTITPNYF